MVPAKPAISVTPRIAGRAPWPSSRPMVANEVSYSPIAMPTPSTVQATYHQASPFDAASSSSPAQVTIAPAARIGRPPARSMKRPIGGAQRAATISDQENPPSSAVRDQPRLSAAAPAMTAGM